MGYFLITFLMFLVMLFFSSSAQQDRAGWAGMYVVLGTAFSAMGFWFSASLEYSWFGPPMGINEFWVIFSLTMLWYAGSLLTWYGSWRIFFPSGKFIFSLDTLNVPVAEGRIHSQMQYFEFRDRMNQAHRQFKDAERRGEIQSGPTISERSDDEHR
ncbi:hypothetical protein HQ571_01340 [Candidatus Kuenenbacteria bacterium]|nr:hypothetical protein [Candidatus Kuenenbacteria bacterium]